MQHKRFFIRLVIWVMVILTLISIYLLSNQTASQSRELSYTFSNATHSLYEYITNTELTPREWHRKVRKLAHAMVFAVLASFIMLLCYVYRVKLLRAMVITLLSTVIFAIADELHQLFVQGRGASAWDVLIDSIGSLIAIVLTAIIFYGRDRDGKKKEKTEK